MLYSRIAGTGGFLPEKTIKNKDLEKFVDTTDEWILERTGISQRHVISEGEGTASMAEVASRKAIESAKIDPNEIGLIIVATSTPDYAFPSTACLLQNRLGIKNNCPAFDVSAACSGFIYALSIADQYIRTGAVKYALIVGADALSRIVDWKDRSTCILFSDGAGAAVLKADESPGVLSVDIYSDGQHKDLLFAKSRPGDSHMPEYIQMRGNEVFKLAVSTLEQLVDNTLLKNNVLKEEVDWLIPHQANLRIIKATAKRLKLSLERVILTVQDQGNTSAASVPLALDIGIRDGRIQAGDLLLLEVFGAGLVWGSSLIRY